MRKPCNAARIPTKTPLDGSDPWPSRSHMYCSLVAYPFMRSARLVLPEAMRMFWWMPQRYGTGLLRQLGPFMLFGYCEHCRRICIFCCSDAFVFPALVYLQMHSKLRQRSRESKTLLAMVLVLVLLMVVGLQILGYLRYVLFPDTFADPHLMLTKLNHLPKARWLRCRLRIPQPGLSPRNLPAKSVEFLVLVLVLLLLLRSHYLTSAMALVHCSLLRCVGVQRQNP